jgi:hypothetical protein
MKKGRSNDLQTRNYAIILVAVAITIVALNANTGFVFADPCMATLNYPIMPMVYSNSNVPVVVAVSATCTTYYGNQLYATGSAFDATSDAELGSVSTVLQSVNGGTVFNGQLGFNLPPSTQGHTVQVSVSIYNGQYGNLITATSETFQLGSGSVGQQVYTTTVTEVYEYPNSNQYPYQYSSAPSQYLFPSHNHHHRWQPQTQGVDSGVLFDYIAIAAILGAVIITTAALVTYGRRQPNWIPIQPPPPQHI